MNKILVYYLTLLGESFKLFGYNFGVLFTALLSLKKITLKSIFVYLSLIFWAYYSLKNPLNYVFQDVFLFLAIFIGYKNPNIYKIFIKTRYLILFFYSIKFVGLYFFIENPVWGGGSFFDGSVYDFGFFKRVQIKGGDILLFFLFLSFINNPKKSFVWILLILFFVFSAGSRILIFSILIVWIYNYYKMRLPFHVKIFGFAMVMIFSFLIYNSSFIQSRLELDDGNGFLWRVLETTVVYDEVKNNSLVFGKGLGGGFEIEIASAAPFDDGINLYTHNIITWIALKAGILGLLLFLFLIYKSLRKLNKLNNIFFFQALVFIIMSLVNNYIGTFTGAILFFSFLKYYSDDINCYTSTKNKKIN